MMELLINNGGRLQQPPILDGVTWTTERRGTPGKLAFTVIKDSGADFHEGNPVRFTVDGVDLFYGYVFTKKRDRQHHISVTAYDQIRYLLNEDTLPYTNMTASDFIRSICNDYDLNAGEIEQTGFNIADRIEDGSTLLDMIYTALDMELTNQKRMFILYDDFGKLTLKSLDNMKLDLVIDEDTAENFDYTSSIDDGTYNRIKLYYDNEDTGKREIYVAQSGESINNWGLLQYYDELKKGENGERKADALLDLYNAKTRKLKISKAAGDKRVRGGSLVIVKLGLGDINISNYFLVEKCTHTFTNNDHRMDLVTRGGEFTG